MATWVDPSLCVQNSTGFSKRTKEGRQDPPKSNEAAPSQWFGPIQSSHGRLDQSQGASTGLLDADIYIGDKLFNLQPCELRNSKCGRGARCREVDVKGCGLLRDGRTPITWMCLPTCTSHELGCSQDTPAPSTGSGLKSRQDEVTTSVFTPAKQSIKDQKSFGRQEPGITDLSKKKSQGNHWTTAWTGVLRPVEVDQRLYKEVCSRI
ncbi:hypothetical protein EJ07DRAFT_160517 [Lizonia empirigonia]|nr:hypothetical protein EJ07DRAFT_160517 [Lizonia empirigonia]